MNNPEALQKLKELFENQKKYETEVFLNLVAATSKDAGIEGYAFLGDFITTSDNNLIIPRIIEILGNSKSDAVIPFIVNTMKGKSTPGICRETANALGAIGSRKAKEALEHLFEIKLDPVMKELFKRKISEIIRENPIEYVWMPKLLLGSKMASSCIDASKSLARIAKEKAIPALLSEIFNKDLLIRTVIVTALGDIGSDRAVETLFQVFRESFAQEHIRDSYESAINSIKTLIPAGGAEEKAVELLEKNTPPEFSAEIRTFLGDYKTKVPKKIIGEAEELFAKGLGGLARHIVSLLRFAPHKDEETFNKAIAYVLKEIDMEANEHGKIMSEVIFALGKILSKSRLKELEIKEFLLSEAEKVRDEELKAYAIEILGSIPGEDIVDKLITLTEDNSWKIREKAVYSLGEIGNKRAIEILKKSCEDMHQNVSASAMEALAKIDKNAVVELFDSENWRIKKLALTSARTFISPEIARAAQKLLNDEKYDVAFEAIDTIGSDRSGDSVKMISELIKKDGNAKIQEKVLEKLETISSCAVVENLIIALESEIPFGLYANVQRTLLNVISKADFEIKYECMKKIKDNVIEALKKNDMKVKLNALSLSSELANLQLEDYDNILLHLKGFDKYRNSKNPQEKALVMGVDSAISLLDKRKKDIFELKKNKDKITSLFEEIFDRNETRSKNAILEIWKTFSTTELSHDTEVRQEIWERFSKRILMPETSPYTREILAKVFGAFADPRAVPILLKFRDSKVHAERLAVEGAIKNLAGKFTREEIIAAVSGKPVSEINPSAATEESTAPTAAPQEPPKTPQEPVAPPAPPPPTPAEPGRTDYKILIVDDSMMMRNLYNKMLKGCGYRTDVAKDGVETFEKIKDNEYDILLLDLKLPDIGGIDILKRISMVSKNKKLKTIIVSSYIDAENTQQAFDVGAVAVFAKPVDIDMLSTKIKVIMR